MAAKKKFNFEASMVRLEEIVSLLEKGDAPLEKAMSLFEEGAGLLERMVLEKHVLGQDNYTGILIACQ